MITKICEDRELYTHFQYKSKNVHNYKNIKCKLITENILLCEYKTNKIT